MIIIKKESAARDNRTNVASGGRHKNIHCVETELNTVSTDQI